MKQKIHIVSLENPFPPDYGGVIGIFNRICALHESGTEVHLHVFYYDREPRKELELFCHKVYYYRRDMRKSLLFSKFPFIVASRSSKKLLQNLKNIDAPVLFEGLHCCFWLSHPDLKKRIRLVRMHNIEHEYYHHLALAEKNYFKRWYLKNESIKLKKFEQELKNCHRILSVVESDQEYFSKAYGNSELMPVFIDESRFRFSEQQNPVVIYHGNLSVVENTVAAEWLIENVFSKIPHTCIIAGKNPSASLTAKILKYSNIELLANPSKEMLDEKINVAAVCVLPTFQATGIKLKLIDSLMQGKHCIVNRTMLTGTSLEKFCLVAESPADFIHQIDEAIKTPFSFEKYESRKAHMLSYFNNTKSVNRILDIIKDAGD